MKTKEFVSVLLWKTPPEYSELNLAAALGLGLGVFIARYLFWGNGELVSYVLTLVAASFTCRSLALCVHTTVAGRKFAAAQWSILRALALTIGAVGLYYFVLFLTTRWTGFLGVALLCGSAATVWDLRTVKTSQIWLDLLFSAGELAGFAFTGNPGFLGLAALCFGFGSLLALRRRKLSSGNRLLQT